MTTHYGLSDNCKSDNESNAALKVKPRESSRPAVTGAAG